MHISIYVASCTQPTSSSGAWPVPYRLMPFRSPRACLKAICAVTQHDRVSRSYSAMHERETGRTSSERQSAVLGRVVVVDPEVSLAVELEGHACSVASRNAAQRSSRAYVKLTRKQAHLRAWRAP